MQQTLPATIRKAPRLYRRRLVRDFFFPLVQLVSVVIIAAAAYLAGLHWTLAAGWLLVNLMLVLALDLASPQSLTVRVVVNLGELFRVYHVDRQAYADQRIVYSLYPPTPLSPYFPYVRVWSPFISLAFIWALAWLLGWQSGSDDFAMRFVALLLLLYGLIPFRLMIVGVMKHRSRHLKRASLYLSIGFAFLGGVAIFWQLIDGVGLLTPIVYGTLGMLTVLAVYTAVFIAVRLDVGTETTEQVIRDISMRTLATSDGELALADVAEMIGDNLSFERAFILEPNTGTNALIVTGTYGDKEPDGHIVPIENSITGMALLTGESIVWNDVSACHYCHHIQGRKSIGAEMAIPIKHQGTVFGVLDVQSKRKNVFTPSDHRSLQTIANLIGVMLALQQRERFFNELLTLWQELADITTLTTEESIVRTFTVFVHEKLFADLVIYYPLTLAGLPIKNPQIVGNMSTDGTALHSAANDLNCYLLHLIENWEPRFFDKLPDLLPQGNSDVYVDFLRQEEIGSGCFVPVGSPQERLGALLICFRHPTVFDAQRQFTILSLAQSLAKEVAQIRYFDIFHRGPGRPDLGLHSLIGRRGVKGKIRGHIVNGTLEEQSPLQLRNTIAELSMALQDVNTFIDDALALESAIPPVFQRDNLELKLREHGTTLTQRSGHRRPDIRYHVDDTVERENHWIKLVLYRVATEAMNNAVFHGEAEQIKVCIARGDSHIDLKVINAGKPLPEDAAEKWSRSGIYALVKQCREELGAEGLIASLPDQSGACVTLVIPMLPLRRKAHV